jgi:hypothetical protein
MAPVRSWTAIAFDVMPRILERVMKPSNSRVPWAFGRFRLSLGLLLAAAVVLAWWVLRPQPQVSAGAPVVSPVVSQPSAPAVKRAPSPYSSVAPVAGPNRSLLDERAARLAANPLAEPLDPAAAKAAYRSALERYAALRFGGGSPTQLQEVARILDAGIDARVDRNEIALADALELMAELLDVLEPDPARRGLLLAQWREQKLATAAPSRPRDPELVRREAEQVAAWQAVPAERRDARELERQIRQLQQPPARR